MRCKGRAGEHKVIEFANWDIEVVLNENGKIIDVNYESSEDWFAWFGEEEGYYYEIVACAGLPFVKQVDETGETVDVYCYRMWGSVRWSIDNWPNNHRWLGKEAGYHYELENCGGIAFVKKLDKMGKVRLVYCQQRENAIFPQEEGYYYEIEVCAESVVVKKMDDKAGLARDVYRYTETYNIGIEEGYYYELQNCANKLFYLKQEEATGLTRDVYYISSQVVTHIQPQEGYYYEVEVCAGEIFIKKMHDSGQYAAICAPYASYNNWCLEYLPDAQRIQPSSCMLKEFIGNVYLVDGEQLWLFKCGSRYHPWQHIAKEDWIGKFENPHFQVIHKNYKTYFYEKNSKTICDSDGIIIFTFA